MTAADRSRAPRAALVMAWRAARRLSRWDRTVASLACGILLIAAGAAGQTTPVCSYTVVNVFPHDSEAFTQGLVFDGGELFEGTGLYYGRSSLRRVDLETGAVLQQIDLDGQYFGEGIAIVGQEIFQLTWLNHVAFVYDKTTFSRTGSFTCESEGWGLTFDGSHLIQSNGSAILELRDPATFEKTAEVAVFDDVGPVTYLNELEMVGGDVLANIWYSDRVAVIDPVSGMVKAYIDLGGLLASMGGAPGADVLNGVAFDATSGRLFVTGKLWPWLFEIEVPDCPIAWLFSDGFESGDTTRWSESSTPAPRTASGRAGTP